MRLLVTGGAGFIGSNFIRHMLRTHPEYDIINLDSLTYAGRLDNLHDLSDYPHYRFVKGNICDQALVESLVSGETDRKLQIDSKLHANPNTIDALVHFAAESHVDRSINDPSVFIGTNVLGTQVLLEASRKYKIKKFIQISTDEVYGSLGFTGYFTEESPLAPNSPYSASKAGADLLVRSYFKTYGVPVNITRCSNNYGPYQFPEKLISLFVTNAIENQLLPLYGDGLNIRDWIHVEDHCRAIDLVLHKGIPGETYNIGGNNEWTNLQIAKKLLTLLDKPVHLIQFVKDRPGHDHRYAIDSTKIRTRLGWKPVYSFETGIEKTVEWYVNHPDWWVPIKRGLFV